jgi:hypothetical protein
LPSALNFPMNDMGNRPPVMANVNRAPFTTSDVQRMPLRPD